MAKAASKNKDTFQQIYFWKKLLSAELQQVMFMLLNIAHFREQITNNGEHWTVVLAVDGPAHFVQYCGKWWSITYGQGGK